MKSTDFVVARDDLQQCKLIETQLPDAGALPDDALLVKVTRFAFTANNITYAVLGDSLKYWQLFPAPQGFGNIPVWGFGEVIASKHPDDCRGRNGCSAISRWRRISSSRPPTSASAACATPPRIGKAWRRSTTPMRASAAIRLSPAGRATIRRCCGRCSCCRSWSTIFSPRTSFTARTSVMLSSASSKTAFGLAHLLHAQRNGIKVIGLTSAANADFVRSLGCYDEVVTYDDVTSLPTDSPVAYVDMAGNSQLRAKLHRHFGEQMKYSRPHRAHPSQLIARTSRTLPGAKPTWFFAPDQIRKRAKEWGPGGIDTRFGAAWAGFAPKLDRWLRVSEAHGPAAVRAGLSRYPQRPRSAGTGSYPVAVGIGGISSRPFCGIPNGYRVGQGKRRADGHWRETLMLDKTDDISVGADNWLVQFEEALARPDDGLAGRRCFTATAIGGTCWR